MVKAISTLLADFDILQSLDLTTKFSIDTTVVLSAAASPEVQFASRLTAKGIAFLCSTVGLCVSSFLIYQHLVNYNNKTLQRSIVRIQFISPIYSVFSFLSLLFSAWFLLFDAIRDIWEAVVIYCFMTLILDYCGGETACAQAMQSNPGTIQHPLPFGFFLNRDFMCLSRVIRCDPRFVKICKRATLQFVSIKPVMALLSIILFFTGHYSTIYWRIFESVVYNLSYSVALYALVLFWFALRYHPALKATRALRKFVSVKIIVFATFWQSAAIGLVPGLSEQESRDWANFILCCEIPLIAFLQWWAFPVSEFKNSMQIPSVMMSNLPVHDFNNLNDYGTAIEMPKAPFGWAKFNDDEAIDDDIETSINQALSAEAGEHRNSEDLQDVNNEPTGEFLDRESFRVAMIRDVEIVNEVEQKEHDCSAYEFSEVPGWSENIQNSIEVESAEEESTRKLDEDGSSRPNVVNTISKRINNIKSSVTDKKRRDLALKSVKDVVNVSDVLEDAYHSFSTKYGKHSRLDPDTTSRTPTEGEINTAKNRIHFRDNPSLVEEETTLPERGGDIEKTELNDKDEGRL